MYPVSQCVVLGLHAAFIVTVMAGWTVYPLLSLSMPIVGISWALNNNRCLLSQVEWWWFGRPLLPDRISRWTRVVLWLDVGVCLGYTMVPR